MIRNSDIDRLRGLFAKRLIATMDMLKKTVGTVAEGILNLVEIGE